MKNGVTRDAKAVAKKQIGRSLPDLLPNFTIRDDPI
jgi:hypothetical protein